MKQKLENLFMNVESFQLFFQKNNRYIWVKVTVCGYH